MNVLATPPVSLFAESSLTDRDWRKILRDIRDGKVIPVIGPELVTVPDPATGNTISLYQYLAPRLAQELGLPDPTRYTAINTVACDYLLACGSRADIYDELGEIPYSSPSPASSGRKQPTSRWMQPVSCRLCISPTELLGVTETPPLFGNYDPH